MCVYYVYSQHDDDDNDWLIVVVVMIFVIPIKCLYNAVVFLNECSNSIDDNCYNYYFYLVRL